MSPTVASFGFAIVISGLFYLDRDKSLRISKALWIPTIWLFVVSSRPLSMWLGMAPTFDSAEAYAEGSPLDRAVLLALLLAGVGVLMKRMDGVGPLLRRNGPVVAFFLFCGVSVLWSDFPAVAVKRWIKAIGDLVMVLIVLTEPDDMIALKGIVTRLGFLLFPLSVLFIKYYPDLGRVLTNSWTMEAIGVTEQKNTLGVICMSYGICFLWMLRTTYRDRGNPSRGRRLVAHAAVLATIVWLLVVCNSMTSIVGLATAGAVMWLAGRPSLVRRPVVIHLLCFAVLGISVTALFFDPGGDLLGAVGRDPTLTGRTEIWSVVLGLHTNPWIGTGFESFWLGDRLKAIWSYFQNFPINEAHNGYLEIYLNLGWIGVTLLAFLLLTGYRRVSAAFRTEPERGSLLLALFLAALFESFTEAAFRMMSPAWVFLLLVIIAASKTASHESSVPTTSEFADYQESVWMFGSARVGIHQ